MGAATLAMGAPTSSPTSDPGPPCADAGRSAAKTILITGVTKGLGRVLAEGFAKLGHKVIGCGRSREEIELLQARYPHCDFQVRDLASKEDIGSWLKDVEQKH